MKIIDCAKVNPTGGCPHVIEGATDEEVLRKAREHAKKDHQMDLTPEMMQKLRLVIETR